MWIMIIEVGDMNRIKINLYNFLLQTIINLCWCTNVNVVWQLLLFLLLKITIDLITKWVRCRSPAYMSKFILAVVITKISPLGKGFAPRMLG